jgi:uracil-DNA glycosylase
MESSTIEKQGRLLELVRMRREEVCHPHKKIGEYYDGIYECEFVSPCSKEAHNFDSPIMILLQDWSSDDDLKEPPDLDPALRNCGFSPRAKTTRILRRLLYDNFRISLEDTYATNLFPFIKNGRVTASIPGKDLKAAAKKYGLEQIKIIEPRLVIVLGVTSYRALLHAIDETIAAPRSLEEAIANPTMWGSEINIWCQAHTGNSSGRTANQVGKDWKNMADSFVRDYPAGHPASTKNYYAR